MLCTSRTSVKVGGAVAMVVVAGALARAALEYFSRRREAKGIVGQEKVQSGNGVKQVIRPVSPIQRRGFTKEELLEYDGVRRTEVYISVKSVVYEVAPQFYGPGAPYHVYAGREISRCLAKSDLTGKEANKYWLPGCSKEEMQTLEFWVKRLESKYPVVGWFLEDEEFFRVEEASDRGL